MKKVVFVTDKPDVLHALFEVLTEDHANLKVTGVAVLPDGELAVTGCTPATLEEAVRGAAFIFIGEGMPLSSERCLETLRMNGLSEQVRIVGTSRQDQPYADVKMLITHIVGSPAALDALLAS